MAPPNPVERHAAAVEALDEATRLPIGSARRADLLMVAQANALLTLVDVVGYAMTPRRIVVPEMAVGLSPDEIAAEIQTRTRFALPADEDALLGLTHPPTPPRKRASRVKTPKPTLGTAAEEAARPTREEFRAMRDAEGAAAYSRNPADG